MKQENMETAAAHHATIVITKITVISSQGNATNQGALTGIFPHHSAMNVFLESMDHTVQINAVSFVVIKNVIEIPDIVYTDVKEVTTEVTVNIHVLWERMIMNAGKYVENVIKRKDVTILMEFVPMVAMKVSKENYATRVVVTANLEEIAITLVQETA